jgi:hypothetical protein
MQTPASTLDLDDVHALNRLFLSFLQTELRNGRICLGLPQAAAELLRAASAATLDRAAVLPRALFRLDLRTPLGDDRLSTRASPQARMAHSLQLTILLTVWNVSRQSPYRARAFFGLSSREVQRMRALSLSELPTLGLAADLVVCGFEDAGWLWRQLLAPEDPTSYTHLKLVALQPATRRSLV